MGARASRSRAFLAALVIEVVLALTLMRLDHGHTVTVGLVRKPMVAHLVTLPRPPAPVPPQPVHKSLPSPPKPRPRLVIHHPRFGSRRANSPLTVRSQGAFGHFPAPLPGECTFKQKGRYIKAVLLCACLNCGF